MRAGYATFASLRADFADRLGETGDAGIWASNAAESRRQVGALKREPIARRTLLLTKQAMVIEFFGDEQEARSAAAC